MGNDKRQNAVCEAFIDKIVEVKGFENKVRHLLNDFFFKEGWASRTNPNSQKEGYNSKLTYNESTIRHFIEDFSRWLINEFKDIQKKKEEERDD